MPPTVRGATQVRRDRPSFDTPSGGPPTWSTPREALGVIAHPPHLQRTILVAVVVGSVLFVINHLDVVLRGEAGTVVWAKGAITFLVPFAVSNYGILTATRRSRSRDAIDKDPVCSSSSA